nr:hypothetical protein [Candidatus Freyarchaeota archaeon]
MESPEKITSLLKDFFNLTYGCMVEFYQILEGKSGLYENELKEYKYGQFGVIIRKYVNSELTYIYFLEEYIKMFSKWFEAFSSLVDTLGSREYHRILLGEVELQEVINISKIDINFLKFRIKNFLNPNFSDLETTCRLLLQKSKSVLEEEIDHLKTGSSKRFTELIENQARGWLMVNEEVQNSLQSLTQVEDKSQIVSTLTLIAQKCVDFFEKIIEARKSIKISDEDWAHFIAGDFIEYSSRFKKLREDMTQLFNYMIKTYEHLANCFFHIFNALWGREEVALSKIEDSIKSKIPAEGLVPKNFSIKDLAFGLSLALSELGQAHLASQGSEEKKIAIDIVATAFPKSEGLQVFPNRIMRLLELKEKYLYKINDIMIDMQKLVQQNAEPEKPIFGG